jgi:hypothetical protein
MESRYFQLPIADFQFSNPVSQHSIGNRQSEIGNNLSFRKLESFPSTLLSVLFAFLDSRIARHKTGVFESRTKVGIEFEQRSRDAVSDRSGLARRTTAGDVDNQIKLVRGFSQLQGLTDDHSQRFVGKVSIERFVINLDFARAGSQINSGRCRFAPPCSVILNISHSNLPLSSTKSYFELVF